VVFVNTVNNTQVRWYYYTVAHFTQSISPIYTLSSSGITLHYKEFIAEETMPFNNPYLRSSFFNYFL